MSITKFKGWNNQGIPTEESLHELDLDYVSKYFLEKGILTQTESTPPKESPTEKEQKKSGGSES